MLEDDIGRAHAWWVVLIGHAEVVSTGRLLLACEGVIHGLVQGHLIFALLQSSSTHCSEDVSDISRLL